jgi:hypothetical protein
MYVLLDLASNREVCSLSETLSHAQMLMKILTEEPSRKSDNELKELFLCIKGSIPHFSDTMSAIKGPAIPEDLRLKLRESLRKDMDRLITKAKHYDMEPKAFDRYVMCYPSQDLKEMEELKKEEMKQLQADLDDIICAQNALKDIEKLDKQAKRLETTLNNPERAAKKPRS